MSDYNGWSNRETWLVNLWFNPETKADIYAIRDILEEEFNSLPPFWKDMVDFGLVDWEKLESILDDEEIEEE